MAPDSETTSEKVEKNLSDLTLHEICCLTQDDNHKMKDRSDVEKGEDIGSVNKKNHEGSVGDDGIPIPEVQLYPPGQVCLEWIKVHKVGAGLANLGNTCFLNTVIQCLTYCPPLANYLLQGDHSTNCKSFEFCLMCELQKHMRQVFQRSGDVIKPLCIYQNLKYIADHFQFGQQEDAHEFLRFVIDNLWRSSMYSYVDDILDSASRETTIINHIFGGYNRSQVVCLRCNLKSDKYEHFMDFILDIQNAHSLEKAVEQFVKPELLENENAYKCPKCDALVPAEKTFTIHRPPNVATFQLKRFDLYKSYGKITKHISYPEKFDLRPYMSQRKGSSLVYKLNAVLVHMGQNSNSGHYYCYIRNSNGCWYLMDDAKVQKVSLRDVLNQQAYVLFYIRSSHNGIHFKKNGVSSVMNFDDMNLRCPDGIVPQLSSAKKNYYFHNSSKHVNKSVEDGCYSGDRTPLSSHRTLNCGLSEPLSELNVNSINRMHNDDESANVKSSCALKYSNRRSPYTHNKRSYNHKKVTKRTYQKFHLQYKNGSCEEYFIPWSCDSPPYLSSGFEKNYQDNRHENSVSVNYAYSAWNGMNCQSYARSIEHEFPHEYQIFDENCSQWNDFFAKRNFSLPRKPKVSRNHSFSKKNDFFISRHFIGHRQRCYYAISGKSNSIQHDEESLYYKFCRYNGTARKKFYANNDARNSYQTQENNTDGNYCVPMFPSFKHLHSSKQHSFVQHRNGFTRRNSHSETYFKNREHHKFTDIIQSNAKHFPVRCKRNSGFKNGYFKKGYDNDLFWRKDYSPFPNVWRDYNCRMYEGKMKGRRQYSPCRMARFAPQFPKFKNLRRP